VSSTQSATLDLREADRLQPNTVLR